MSLATPDKIRDLRIKLYRKAKNEPEFRFYQLDDKVPDLIRRCQAQRQSPLLSSFPSSPEARVLPSTGITRLQRYR